MVRASFRRYSRYLKSRVGTGVGDNPAKPLMVVQEEVERRRTKFRFTEPSRTYRKSQAAGGASGSVALARRFPKGTPRRGDLGQRSTNSGAEFGLFWWERHKI
ncbi:hypothetical protein PGTUg99_014396 [Puccinia graminis f. sp. tritici]|uniref:Uncharacterized protein n=1 Tax=Puccinia graminis f. sp. tritici TaxID=56615 RepID=A0A5B0NVK5_PUCGR|nr:hypothetical protein PGTUg99_014396 [Puccinia graminis f. sp. tritici]